MTVDTSNVPLGEALQEYAVPGAQVGLLRGVDRVVCSAGVLGLDDTTPVSSSTTFHAGSLGKSLTGLAVLDAARRAVIDLDRPCAEQGRGLWHETPRAILTQTTGRPNLLPGPNEGLAEFVARSAELPLVHEPGLFSYCNAGWIALDLLLRLRTGRGVDDAAPELTGLPLLLGPRPNDRARGHQVTAEQSIVAVADEDWPAASGAGSRWWATADTLLDVAEIHLGTRPAPAHPDDLRALAVPVAELPGRTVFDAWGMGFATWDRGEHHAFGWAGYTEGHRAFLRCFPDQEAALVVLTNSAGPLVGPPGGSALFDALLPALLAALGVPPLPGPAPSAAPRPVQELTGQFGPLMVGAEEDGTLLVDFRAMGPLGAPEPVRCTRLAGTTFVTEGEPPGSTPLAIVDDVLYLGPFAMPRVS